MLRISTSSVTNVSAQTCWISFSLATTSGADSARQTSTCMIFGSTRAALLQFVRVLICGSTTHAPILKEPFIPLPPGFDERCANHNTLSIRGTMNAIAEIAPCVHPCDRIPCFCMTAQRVDDWLCSSGTAWFEANILPARHLQSPTTKPAIFVAGGG